MPAKQANICVKGFLVLVNFLFLAIGGVVFGTGVYLYASDNIKNYADLITAVQDLQSLRALLVGCGAIIMLIALCGCVGACCENKCLMIVYCVLLGLLLLGNCVAMILSVVYSKQVRQIGIEQVRDKLKNNYGNTSSEVSKRITQSVDKVQRATKCCGWSGDNKEENIFKSTPWFEIRNQNVSKDMDKYQLPESCCVATAGGKLDECRYNKDIQDARKRGHAYKDDCVESLLAMNGCFLRAVLAAVIAAIVLQVICVTCACVLVRQVSNSDGTVV